MFLSILQALVLPSFSIFLNQGPPQLFEFPFDQIPEFAQFCSRFDGFLYDHPMWCRSFGAPTKMVVEANDDLNFGCGLSGRESSVPFYHDGSEIQVFLSPNNRVGHTCEYNGMSDAWFTFGGFIEKFVFDILVSGQTESDWFDEIMLRSSKTES